MQIGTVKIESKLALAPMAGVTDAAFRQICSEKGAGYTVTELVSAKALCYHDTKTAQLLRPFPGEKPFAAQIFGSDVNCMAEAAQMPFLRSGAGSTASDRSHRFRRGSTVWRRTPASTRCGGEKNRAAASRSTTRSCLSTRSTPRPSRRRRSSTARHRNYCRRASPPCRRSTERCSSCARSKA